MPNAASLPPRHALPRDVEIPSLPGLGTTWYDRGPAYWARRVTLTLLLGLGLLLIGLISAGFLSAVRRSSQAAFAVLLVIDVALAAAAIAYFAIRTVQRWNVAMPPGRARTVFRVRQGRAGTFLSGLTQLGYLLLILIGAIVFVIFPGFILALFLMSLLPEPLVEHQARLWMAGQLRERGIPAG